MAQNKITFLNTKRELRAGDTGNVIAVVDGSEKSNVQIMNSLGGEQSITTLTSILADVIDQKFFTLDIAKYVPVITGEGNPWAYSLMNWKTQINRSGLEGRIVNLASNNSTSPSDNVGIEPITRNIINWKDDISYNLMQENTYAAATKNMDYIAELYEARKRIWDLDIQEVSMYGNAATGAQGLLTQSTVTANTSLITKFLNTMTAAEFNAVVGGLITAYRTNCNYTAYPNKFIIPESDYNALVNQMSETYPLRTKLDVLKTALAEVTQNPNFEVLPLAYAAKTVNASISGLNKNRYILTNSDRKSIRMDIPLNFTVTLPNSADNFNFTSSAYGRFTGVKTLRDAETLYFDHTV